jgi:hypothetical protein
MDRYGSQLQSGSVPACFSRVRPGSEISRRPDPGRGENHHLKLAGSYLLQTLNSYSSCILHSAASGTLAHHGGVASAVGAGHHHLVFGVVILFLVMNEGKGVVYLVAGVFAALATKALGKAVMPGNHPGRKLDDGKADNGALAAKAAIPLEGTKPDQRSDTHLPKAARNGAGAPAPDGSFHVLFAFARVAVLRIDLPQ